MLGSLGSQLGALQLGSVPQAAGASITGTGSVTFGPPTIAAIGQLPVPSFALAAAPARPPLPERQRIHGTGTVRIARPRIAARGQQIHGRASIETAAPVLAALGAQVFAGRAAMRAVHALTVARAAVTHGGRSDLVSAGVAVVARGIVGSPPVVATERPRLRSLPEAPSVRVRVRRVPVSRLPVVDVMDAVDAAWQQLQQERDEAEALMVLGRSV